jgi:hypothetical protein
LLIGTSETLVDETFDLAQPDAELASTAGTPATQGSVFLPFAKQAVGRISQHTDHLAQRHERVNFEKSLLFSDALVLEE